MQCPEPCLDADVSSEDCVLNTIQKKIHKRFPPILQFFTQILLSANEYSCFGKDGKKTSDTLMDFPLEKKRALSLRLVHSFTKAQKSTSDHARKG
jgi:hypothetical protein